MQNSYGGGCDYATTTDPFSSPSLPLFGLAGRGLFGPLKQAADGGGGGASDLLGHSVQFPVWD